MVWLQLRVCVQHALRHGAHAHRLGPDRRPHRALHVPLWRRRRPHLPAGHVGAGRNVRCVPHVQRHPRGPRGRDVDVRAGAAVGGAGGGRRGGRRLPGHVQVNALLPDRRPAGFRVDPSRRRRARYPAQRLLCQARVRRDVPRAADGMWRRRLHDRARRAADRDAAAGHGRLPCVERHVLTGAAAPAQADRPSARRPDDRAGRHRQCRARRASLPRVLHRLLPRRPGGVTARRCCAHFRLACQPNLSSPSDAPQTAGRRAGRRARRASLPRVLHRFLPRRPEGVTGRRGCAHVRLACQPTPRFSLRPCQKGQEP
mmetsp:Transcript_15908/g.47123  ORF Transcript_15908/g.47123 Transcript_15908/m.47123 type:complete len:314 (+) Transcript_15908:771-1712(+)